MNKVELINAIRLDIQKEQDAISTYMGQVSKTSDPRVKKVLTSIANEERVHVGELTKLLSILDNECKYMHEGMDEVAKDLHLPMEHEAEHKHAVKRIYPARLLHRHSKVGGNQGALYQSLGGF
jgi:Mn-containing catalase